jgi:hypothetical protein
MQIDPAVASGIPLAVMTGGIMAMIVPVSGGPDAPGLTITIAPMLTGGPGISFSATKKHKVLLVFYVPLCGQPPTLVKTT